MKIVKKLVVTKYNKILLNLTSHHHLITMIE